MINAFLGYYSDKGNRFDKPAFSHLIKRYSTAAFLQGINNILIAIYMYIRRNLYLHDSSNILPINCRIISLRNICILIFHHISNDQIELTFRPLSQEIMASLLRAVSFLRSIINYIVASFRCAWGKVSVRGIPGTIRWNRKSKKKKKKKKSRSMEMQLSRLADSYFGTSGQDIAFETSSRLFSWNVAQFARTKPAPFPRVHFTSNYASTVQTNYIMPTFW